MDAAVGFAFRPPSDPRRAPSSLQRYFDYGRSIEGKLRREVGSTPEQDAAIVKAGWLNDCDIATSTPPGKLAFDIYGMSFSTRSRIKWYGSIQDLRARASAVPPRPPTTAMLALSVGSKLSAIVRPSRF